MSTLQGYGAIPSTNWATAGEDAEEARAGPSQQLGVLEGDPRNRHGHRGGGEAGRAGRRARPRPLRLTELFNEVKGKQTHVIVERIVADMDAIVKQVRFDGWQATAQGEREVKQALRRALLK